MNQPLTPHQRPLRLGLKHGQSVRIGDVVVRVSLDAARSQGRRATLVIDNPSAVPVTLLEQGQSSGPLAPQEE